jgi:C4-dicarboxylate transporter, DctM subunit
MNTVIIVLGVSFVGLLFIGVPIGISIGLSATFGMLASGMSLQYLGRVLYQGLDSYTLIAVPMFILAGSLMEKTGLTAKLIDLAKSIVGQATGGLAFVAIITCVFFAAISGSGAATTAAVGSMLIPAMIKDGYKPSFAGAVCACSGGIGVVIPPSLLFIMYGIIAEVSITRLFIAGVFPGLLLGLFLYVPVFLISKKRNYKSTIEKFSFRYFLRSLYEAKWALISPVIVLGGIYGGIFTVTEASIIAVLYPVVVATFITRQMSWAKLNSALFYAGKICGTVFMILVMGQLFGRILSLNQIPQIISRFLIASSLPPNLLLLLILVFLIFIGMWMETFTQIIILTPLLLPVVVSLGIHPIQFGVMLVVACEIGFETPPLGVNLFVAGEIADTTIEDISKESLPFVLAEFAALVAVTFIPQLSLFLPSLL